MRINQIYRFEELRDGGSLLAAFQADDSYEYWVMFPIANMEVENLEFESPVLINRTTGTEVGLSKEEARSWLKQLKPYFNERPELPFVSKSEETAIWNQMISLCETST